MRNIDSTTVAYLEAREGIVVRELAWFTVKEIGTGTPVSAGLWNDLGTIQFDVISGETGGEVTRTYYGTGGLLSISAIPLVSDLTIQSVTITLSHLDATTLQLMRGYDPRLGRVEIHRALFDLDTRELVAPPVPHFMGTINQASDNIPRAGEEGSISIQVVSHSRELTRTNAAKRSDETQKLRSGDRFREYSGVAGEWEYFWGEQKHKGGGQGNQSPRGTVIAGASSPGSV